MRASGLEVVGLSPGRFDLTRSAEDLKPFLNPETAVVMCSAIKRQAGDNLENYEKNVAMAANVSRQLEESPAGRFVYFSSAAVYGEDVENTAITEDTPVEPTSYYGMAKYASERLLLKAAGARTPLLLLRPATIYGPEEPGRPYGPTGFLRAALAGEKVTLWGDGDEKREFVFIDDACEAVAGLLDHPFCGPLNLVTGRSVSFREVLAAVARIAPAPMTDSRPRSKRKVDHGFDNTLLRAALPSLKFTPLNDAMAASREAALPGLRP